MRNSQINKNKAETEFIVVGNRETANIALGTPVVFVMDGTNDGFDVQLPSSSLASKANQFMAGIACGQGTGALAASAVGQVTQVYGLCPTTLVAKVLTRSATSAVWASNVGGVLGDILSIDTVVNALERLSAGSALNGIYPFVLASAYASNTTLASGAAGTYPLFGPSTSGNGASSDTIAYSTLLTKVFIRMM